MVYKTVATNAPARPNPINNMLVLILGRLRSSYLRVPEVLYNRN